MERSVLAFYLETQRSREASWECVFLSFGVGDGGKVFFWLFGRGGIAWVPKQEKNATAKTSKKTRPKQKN